MEKFWAVILIFVVVAAAGLLYVNQVYNPQKESQAAMAETANQTLSAVKADVVDTAPTTVTAADVISTVNMYCKNGNTVEITVISSTTAVYTVNSTGILTQISNLNEYYTKTIDKEGTDIIKKILFKKI